MDTNNPRRPKSEDQFEDYELTQTPFGYRLTKRLPEGGDEMTWKEFLIIVVILCLLVR